MDRAKEAAVWLAEINGAYDSRTMAQDARIVNDSPEGWTFEVPRRTGETTRIEGARLSVGELARAVSLAEAMRERGDMAGWVPAGE